MAWLAGYSYRKKVTITGQTGAGTLYQVPLKVGESSGVTGADFHVAEHSQSFPTAKNESGDLRFTDNDGETLLDFWTEKVTGTTPNRTATVWVETADDLGSNVDVYCYYGKASPTNVSDGEATFLLFDDFPGTALNTDKWSLYNTPVIAVADSEIRNRANESKYEGIKSVSTWLQNVAARARVRNQVSTGAMAVGFSADLHHDGDLVWFYHQASTENVIVEVYENGTGGSTAAGAKPTAGTYEIQDVLWFSGKAIFKRTGQADVTVTANVPTGENLHARFESWYSSSWASDTYCDWYLVRKCNDPEPAFSSAGGEETVGAAFLLNFI